MRKIEYIFIDPDRPSDDHQSGHYDLPGFRHHFIVNSEGLVINTTDILYPVNLIQGPNYDRDKYNKCSIFIRYNGSLRTEGLEQRAQNRTRSSFAESRQGSTECQSWILEPDTNCSSILSQRAALLQLLVQLRKHFPDAKILAVSELDGRELYSKNIIVSDTMNVLRKELSDLP